MQELAGPLELRERESVCVYLLLIRRQRNIALSIKVELTLWVECTCIKLG